MKRMCPVIMALVVSLSCAMVHAATRVSIAIMPVEAAADVAAGDRQAAENYFYEGLIRSGKFSVVERARIEKILQEQSFSQTGATQKAIEVGKLLRVDKIMTAALYKRNNRLAIACGVIDIATARVELTRERNDDVLPIDLARYAISDIVHRYQVIGEVLGTADTAYICDLGSDDGLQAGSRLYVARKVITRGDKGVVLFEELTRIGTLEVTSVADSRSKAKIRTLENKNARIIKGDLVSPEPLPQKQARVSSTPLLANIAKGRLVLDDDMSTRKYLTAENSAQETYASGSLLLDATKTTMNHAYAVYPAPFDSLTDFILEGEVRFVKTGNRYNYADIVFRGSKPYAHMEGYLFFFNSDGGYLISTMRDGTGIPVVAYTSTPVLNRGENAVNTFRIVAHGPSFDIYMNGSYLAGFEHELYGAGGIYLLVDKGGCAAFDNVRIWETMQK